jgi:hypothetical protein
MTGNDYTSLNHFPIQDFAKENMRKLSPKNAKGLWELYKQGLVIPSVVRAFNLDKWEEWGYGKPHIVKPKPRLPAPPPTSTGRCLKLVKD